MRKTVFLFSIIFLSLSTGKLIAQQVGIGAQFGEPTGLTVRINNAGGVNLDMLAAWYFDQYFFFNVHGLWERRLIKDLPKLNYFYGPGAFIVLHDRYRDRYNDQEVSLGISGSIGLNVYLGRVEIFGQLTPRLALVRSTYGNIGGGIGGRFYLN